jgi:hypothetical protein
MQDLETQKTSVEINFSHAVACSTAGKFRLTISSGELNFYDERR